MTTTKRTAKTTATNTTEILTSAPTPEAFRHASLWIVATKTGRNGPWNFVASANGESVARMILNSFASLDAHVALIPSLISGGAKPVYSYDEETDEEGEAKYVARAPKAIEEWDNGRRIG